jgi:predicted ATPase
MLIGTYRPAELILSGHPLKAVKRELLAKQQCEELPLDYLSQEAVAQYLSVRFPAHRFPSKLTELIYERTEGNPLFMVNAVDYLVAEGSIAEHQGDWELVAGIENIEVGVPDSIKQMIEKQIDHLHANDQRLLEVASVAGAEFSTVGVLAGLGEDRALVEARCDALGRQRQLIQDCGVQILPDGEAVSRYGFIHSLYQEVLYERLSASMRVQLHRRIGTHMETLFLENATEIAAELAMHFERGADDKKAAKYLQQAAANALRRFAYREAVVLSRRGLELLGRLVDRRERTEQELRLHLTLGVALILTQGYASPEVGSAYMGARELCERSGETPEISQVLWGLWAFHTLRAELRTAREIAEELLRLAERRPYVGLAMGGHWTMEITLMHLGEFGLALEHFEKALRLYNREQHRDDAFLYAANYALNPGVAMRCFAAWSLWFMGQPDQSLDRMQEALQLAWQSSDPHGLAHALLFAAVLHQFRREERLAQERAQAAIALSRDHGLVMYGAMATVTRGWALTEQGWQEEGIEQMRQGLADLRATGAELVRPHFLALLAEALGKGGHTDEALRVLEDALTMAHEHGDQYYLAELYRLKGELLLGRPTARALSRATNAGQNVSPESCFHQSIHIAQRQQAKSLELRAVISLARVHRKQRNRKDERGLLAQIYAGFTEGFDTTDLQEAKALLDEFS